jgi:hypothetical protein
MTRDPVLWSIIWAVMSLEPATRPSPAVTVNWTLITVNGANGLTTAVALEHFRITGWLCRAFERKDVPASSSNATSMLDRLIMSRTELSALCSHMLEPVQNGAHLTPCQTLAGACMACR